MRRRVLRSQVAQPPAGYLFTTIRAARPLALSVELSRHEGFGGFGYRPPGSAVGERHCLAQRPKGGAADDRLQGYARVPVAKRRGWHDAVLIDLPLDRGENRLMVVLGKGAASVPWFNAAACHPEPAAPNLGHGGERFSKVRQPAARASTILV